MLTMTDKKLGYDDLRPLMALQTGDERHDAASTSTLDVLWVLYDEVLDITAGRVDDPARDRFFLSKGHGPRPYYAVLAAKGFIPVDWLATFGGFDSPQDNSSATWGWRGGLETRFEVAGWHTVRVDGRDHAALAGALARHTGSEAPNLVVVEVEAAS